MRSNIRLRSNVYLAVDPDAFRNQIRGRTALRKLLRRSFPGLTEEEASRKFALKPHQIAQLAWEMPCAECNGIPEGPVRHGSDILLEFRCPRLRCAQTHGSGVKATGRFVNLSLALVDKTIGQYQADISSILQKALSLKGISTKDAISQSADVLQFTVRLSRTQYYMYMHESLREFSARASASLMRLLEKDNV